MVRVKICGITNLNDAFAAIDHGADALGFIFYTESPRSVTPENAKKIISSLPPFVTTIGVFVDKEKSALVKIASYAGVDAIQLHGSEPPEYCNLNKRIIKALRIRKLSDIMPLTGYKDASAFLLDTYSSDAVGGTGQIFNWNIAIEAKKLGRIILAGGLTPDNVAEAVKIVQPYGVDVASGVESKTKGIKDHEKLKLFIARAKNASLKYYL